MNEAGKNYDLEEALLELTNSVADLKPLMRKVAIYQYNYERSFVENVKEISGNGWTAEEARERYGL